METTLTRWTTPSSYIGASWDDHYYAPCTTHRDADALNRSNWQTQNKELLALDTEFEDESTVRVVSENHWAVGCVEWLAIHESNTAAIEAAEKIGTRMKSYPVLDEEDWSNKEDEEAQVIWRDCYSSKERLAYIRNHRSQFDFNSFEELVKVARGEYFIGYACELIAYASFLISLITASMQFVK